MTLILKGSGVGSGIVIGPAYVADRSDTNEARPVAAIGSVDTEIQNLDKAIEIAADKLRFAKTNLPKATRKDIGAFLDAHILMITDKSLRRVTAEIIDRQKCSADTALLEYRNQIVEVFDRIHDPYLRSKKDEVNQVIRQIQENLPAATTRSPVDLLSEDMQSFVLVAHDLSPADIVMLNNVAPLGGFVTDLGSPVSHAAILAHSLQMPAVVGLHGQISKIPYGVTVAIDSSTGIVYVDPTEQDLEELRRRQQKYEQRQNYLASLVHLRPTTVDGHDITLLANVELPSDIERAVSSGATGVGLYRTEYLFMNRSAWPDEEEQFKAYAKVAETLHKVTIRTLDLGADKQVDGGREQGNVAINPALGIRAIRLCLKQPELFIPQLRAIYRASAYGDVQCMIPMLCSVEELEQVLAIFETTREELSQEGIDFNPNMPIGAMIEVPAAAIAADLFAERLDFLSIGTNDLIQYTLAIDRVDDEVNYLYDPMHLSMLRLIKNTIDAGAQTSTSVSMCGEMASDMLYTRLLLGMGLKEFSINPSALPEIKQLVRSCSIEQIESITDEIIVQPNASRRQELLAQLNSITFGPAMSNATM